MAKIGNSDSAAMSQATVSTKKHYKAHWDIDIADCQK